MVCYSFIQLCVQSGILYSTDLFMMKNIIVGESDGMKNVYKDSDDSKEEDNQSSCDG